MTRNSYKNLLIESAVADIKKIEVFKSPADKILDSARKGTVAKDVADIRDAESAIAVLGRIYDAQDEDRPLIRENDEENEAQGDSEITVDMPDHVQSAKIQDIADVIDDDAGCEANPGQEDQFSDNLPDEAQDTNLDESFILEDDEELPEDEEPVADDTEEELPEDEEPVAEEEDEVLPEDEEPVTDDDTEELPEDELPEEDDEGIAEEEDEELPEDEEPASEDDDSGVCPECGQNPCVCDEDELPEDDEPVTEEEDEELPEDEEPASEDDEVLPEDDDDEGITEDVMDSELDEAEQTGEDEILAGEGDSVPAEEIPVDGQVYDEGAEDATVDPNVGAEMATEDTEDPTVDPNGEPTPPPAEAEQPVEGDQTTQAPAEDETQQAQVEDQPTEEEKDPVLDIDSQVVASDTTQEHVMESLIRCLKEDTSEGYLNYEQENIESED